MFKKLDKLILKAFIGPFVATFFITVFVFVMQFFWKYIDDLVGKGLDMFTIIKLTGYGSITFMVLALPLAILISSIMTFGNLGESFELVAIRSSGIPLLRFMQPLIITTILISIASFSLANYVVPVANLKFVSQLWDIRVAKPAFDIREGIFYDKLTNFAIKVGRKDKNGTGIYDVVIYENDFRMQDNIIVAEKGNMSISEDKKFMEFDLQNGWRYQERGGYSTKETDYIRIKFKEYKKSFDLSSFGVMKTPDSAFRTNGNMLNVRQLQNGADSVNKLLTYNIPKRFTREISGYLGSGKLLDSGWKYEKVVVADSVKNYYRQMPDSSITSTYSRYTEKLNLIKSSNDLINEEYKFKNDQRTAYKVEWQKKFALPFACLVLFMIGAPLGSIIRKGGLGMPLVIAVIFFLIFHLLNMFGEKLARNETLIPFVGVWLPSIVLLPVGIYLTYKAMHDSQLFNTESYYRVFRKLKKMLNKADA